MLSDFASVLSTYKVLYVITSFLICIVILCTYFTVVLASDEKKSKSLAMWNNLVL